MKLKLKHPLAIAMWDFSWLERRWPGAGYEDWEKELDGLKERGYDAVRIDAYPHLLAADPEGEWILKPEWSQQAWGSPALVKITEIERHLIEFMRLCKERNLAVGLSTWFRQDLENTRMKLDNPESFGSVWIQTLEILKAAGLFDTILYVDLCNEYPLRCWAPFIYAAEGQNQLSRTGGAGYRWMKESLESVRAVFPELDYCFSITTEYETLNEQDISFMDLLDPHIWITSFTDYYSRVGYRFERFDSIGYENLVAKGEQIYRSNPGYWQQSLVNGIERFAEWSAITGKPLITTEGWAIVDYKDWPMLDWDWIKELCEIGVTKASSTGRWAAIATSNFCGPQFNGMWRDVAWHQRLTDLIHNGPLPREMVAERGDSRK